MEPWSELINLAPIGMSYPQTPYESSGDWLRGYGGQDDLWITEQMIYKQGVKTRNDKKPNSDKTNRLFTNSLTRSTPTFLPIRS